MLSQNIKDQDFVSIRQAIAKLGSTKLGTGATPKFAGLTLTGLDASEFVFTDASKALTSVNVPLVVTYGGTGAATLTDHGILLGSGTGAITALGAATNGQLPIGSTGADPVLATLTGTANQVTVTNSAGSIALSLPTDVIISGASTPSITLESTDASDPTIIFKTTNTAHQVEFYLDESVVNDVLWLKGRTAGVDTRLDIEAMDGEIAALRLRSGLTSYGTIYYSATDILNVRNNFEDGDLLFGIDDGGTLKTIIWDADVDKLKHSAGLFHFDDDNLETSGTLSCGVITQSGTTLANTYQPLDAGLTSLAGLTYAAASFVKMTGADTFALRTIGETADDLEATIDHDNLANGGAHDYSYISGNDGATDVTAAQLEELSDGSETTLHTHAAGAPAAHTHDGDTLQLDGINSDGGAFSFTTSGGVVFSNSIIMADGEAIGQSAGPIVRFDDSNNYLEITQCDVGINMTAPSAKLHVSDDGNAVAASLVSNDCSIHSVEGAACGASIVVASGTATHRGVFKGVKSAGTLASPSAPASGDQVLSFLGAIFDGTDTEGTAAVDFVVDGNVSSNVAPQRIGFYTSATNAAGRTERLTVKSNGKIGINSPAIPHGGIGAALLALDSTDSSVNGPHMQFTTASDDYPLLQILPYAHDNVNLVFDAYFDGAWKSSDASSNFKITKTASELGMLWDNTVAQGSAVTWNNGVALNQNGNWLVYNTQFMLERAAGYTDTAGYGQLWVKNDAPNTLWFTNDDGTDYQLGVGSNHAILDGSTHTDSVADGVTRGSIIYGNATPKWDELGLGAANTFLGSDGTDLSYISLGVWTAVSYDSGNFNGSASMTWTVEEGDVNTYSYFIIGKTMWLNFNITYTTVGGTPSTQLLLTVPASKTIAKSFTAIGVVNDNSSGQVGAAFAGASGNGYISLYKDFTAVNNYSAATNATHVYGTLVFEIN